MESFDFELEHPVTVREKSYTKLTIRRPLVRDLIAAERTPGALGSSAALVAICADVPFIDFGHFDGGDFAKILDRGTLAGFFHPEDGQPA